MFEDLVKPIQTKLGLIGNELRETSNQLLSLGNRIDRRLVTMEAAALKNDPRMTEFMRSKSLSGRAAWSVGPLFVDVAIGQVPQGAAWDIERIAFYAVTSDAGGTFTAVAYSNAVTPDNALTVITANSVAGTVQEIAGSTHPALPYRLRSGESLIVRLYRSAALTVAGTLSVNLQIRELLDTTHTISEDHGDSNAPRISGPYQVSDQEFELRNDGVEVPEESQVITPPNVGQAELNGKP